MTFNQDRIREIIKLLREVACEMGIDTAIEVAYKQGYCDKENEEEITEDE